MISLTSGSLASTLARTETGGDIAEQYHALVHWLRSCGDRSATRPKAIGVTGCVAGSGVSTVALNLAMVAAQTGNRPALLLDLSTTRSALASRFSLSGNFGLSEALAQGARPQDCARSTPIPNLRMLAADESDDPLVLSAAGGKIHDLLQSFGNEFDFVVVDLPHTNSNLCLATAGMLDGVLLVMESESTSSEAAVRAKARLMYANASLLGVILNKHRQHLPHWLDTRLSR